jgi:hypothetical protein
MLGIAEFPQSHFPYRFANEKGGIYETGKPEIYNTLWQAKSGG